MELSKEQIETLRLCFREKYKIDFPSTENSEIYERVKNEMDNFLEDKLSECFDNKSKQGCNCISVQKCKKFQSEKPSEQFAASQKQLSQILYNRSEKNTFWIGFIKFCCIFCSINYEEFVSTSQNTKGTLVGSKSLMNKLTDDFILEGKWKYMCTSFNHDYQHGGRFTIMRTKEGYLVLHGQRMWRDTINKNTNEWECIVYKESEYLEWKTVFIFMKNESEIYMEYIIPERSGTTNGYMRCHIIDIEEVTTIYGNFYVLTQELNGTIIFRKVTNEEYSSQDTLPKNH